MSQVTIVIPSYNYGEYLSEAIESALNQTVSCDVIVVDDGSEDDSVEIARLYDDKITLLEQENRGVSAARNRAISLAESDHILPLDADDILYPDCVENLLTLPAGLRTGKCTVFGAGRPDSHRLAYRPSFYDMTRSCRMWQTTMYPKEAWIEVGGYDENIPYGAFEDWDFWVRCLHAGYELHATPLKTYKFRQHGHSLTAVGNEHGDEIREYLHNKWKGLGIE